MQSGTKTFPVDKFLGVNEAADGYTELKMGEASRMVNFTVTDGMNIALRPGIQRLDFAPEREPGTVLASWAGFIGDNEYLAVADFYEGEDRLFLYDRSNAVAYRKEGALGLTQPENAYVKIFPFAGKVYVMSAGKTVVWKDGDFREEEPYIPLVVNGASPQGGGTTLENLNMLTDRRRIDFSADGEATVYSLPAEAVSVERIVIDNEEADVEAVGSYDAASHSFTFEEAPVRGVGNVEFTYRTDSEAAEELRNTIIRMPLVEAYNGSTDTRLFVAGDGSNRCYYTGVPQSGELTALYFPAMNEVAVDMSDSPITGLTRHFGKLLVFKPNGTYTITYEPVTLVDGNTIAGFFLRSANKNFGCDVTGQVQTVDNYPRTVTAGGIYEWRITSSYYQDERYAKRVSDPVERSLRAADYRKIVTVDDSAGQTYYVFLNDGEGTVLVNRYALTREGVWCTYKGSLFEGVKAAHIFDGRMVFRNEKELFYLDEGLSTDTAETAGGETQAIGAVWESGYMDFGVDFRRKYSSNIYISLLPQSKSELVVTAETDRRGEYMEKTVTTNVFDWENANFVDWTFDVNDTPKIHRVRLKVKKFVYYKLIFKVVTKGARATVLSFDQQVRFSSMAK